MKKAARLGSRKLKAYKTPIIFVAVFAIFGTALLLATHAANPVSNVIEPELGTLSSNVSAGTDATASNGKYISFATASTGGMNSGRCSSTATRICYNGKQWNMTGVDMPWYAWGSDFGGGAIQANKADISSKFAQLQTAGIHVVRWWTFEGGANQINRSSDGTPTSLNPQVYTDFDAALQLGNQYNLYFDFTLFSGVASADFPTTWRTNATQRTALANVLAPLFARYKDNPRLMSWELFNEPEWQIWNNIDGANAADCVALANALVSSIRTNAPKTMTTIGEARIDGIPMWKSVDLDFDSPHWYDPMVDIYNSALLNTAAGLQATNGMTRPILLGEFPFTGTTSAQNLARLNDFYTRGYAGGWDWSLFYDHTSDVIKPDLSAEATFVSQHTDIGPQ